MASICYLLFVISTRYVRVLTFSTLINVPLTIHFVNRVYDFFIFSPVPPGYAVGFQFNLLTIPMSL